MSFTCLNSLMIHYNLEKNYKPLQKLPSYFQRKESCFLVSTFLKICKQKCSIGRQNIGLKSEFREGQGFSGGSVVKNPPAMQEMWVQSLGQQDLLEKEMATYSSFLAWEIPQKEEPDELQSIRSQKVGYNLATKPPPPKGRVHKR